MAFNPIGESVDFIILAGEQSPGIATVLGAGSPRKWEERAGYGYGGAFLVFRGNRLAKFTVELRLYTEEDFAGWESFRPLVMRPPPVNPGTNGAGVIASPFGRRPNAMDIYHPILDDLGIRSVVVEDVMQPRQTGDRGEWVVAIKFLEFRTPRFQLSRPDGSEDRPLSRNERRIQDLSEQNQALAAELNQ